MTVPIAKAIPRLFFLAVEHHPTQPVKSLLKYLPQSDLLIAGGSSGVNGAAALLRVKRSQLQELYRLGSKPNKGSVQEYKVLVAEVISGAIDEIRDDLMFNDYLSMIEALNRYVNGSATQAIVPYEEVKLDEVNPEEVEDIRKWNSGYAPIDQIVGGLYQGILLIMMKPGSGKTSHMLRMAEDLRGNPEVSNIWFFESEVPRTMMLYRIKPILERTPFHPGDRLVCGFMDIKELVQQCIDHPDDRRVIFIDSPDSIATGQDKRYALEEFYRELNWIKSLNRLIVVSSQPRRNDRVLTQESVSDSWAKTWYSDMIVTGQKLGRVPGSTSTRRVSFRVSKNRFGLDGTECEFSFDYANLTYEDLGNSDEAW